MIILSIIIPVYNVEKYLDECINSIIHSGDSRIELILVNDGSTDTSATICEKYASQNNNISLINQKNLGQGFARNKGLKKARGKWIWFIDSDDFIKTEYLPNLINILANTEDIDRVVFNTSSYYESSNSFELFTDYTSLKFSNIMEGNIFLKLVLKNDISYGYPAWFYIVKKEVLDNNNIDFPVDGTSEDVLYTYKVWIASKKVYYYPYEMYCYRREQPNSTTHNINHQFLITLLDRIIFVINDLNTRKLDEELKKLIIMSQYNLLTVVYMKICNINSYDIYFEKINYIRKKMNIHFINWIYLNNKIKILIFIDKTFGLKSVLKFYKVIKKFKGDK